MHPLAGPDGGIRTALAHWDYMNSMCPRDDFLLEEKKKKVAAGGGAIKQHISPNAQLAKQT